MCNKLESVEKQEYYGNYEKFFLTENNTKKQLKKNDKIKLHVSVSTPAIPSKDNPNRYLGVGHIKYTNQKIGNIKTDEFKKFYSKTKKYNRYVYSDYLMFIYEFDPRDGHLTRTSDFFIPEDSEYLLVFPTGLIYVEDQLYILYGDHDSNCKAMIIDINMLIKY